MKLSKLIEQDNVIPSEDDVKVKARDIINKTINKWKTNYIFDKQFSIPEGNIRVSCIFDTPVDENEQKVIELGLTFVPNMEPKPVIPRDLLANAVSKFIDDIIIMNPNLLNDSKRYPMDVLNEYFISFYSVNIYPSEGIINLFDFIQRNLYNMKVKNPRHFGDLLRNRTYLLNHYTFDEGVIPRFSDNYSKQMEKAIRRCKAVFRSFEKGTWNGHKYELTPFYLPNVVIHQEKSGYSVESGVIHPNLSITYSGGWPILDGQKLNQVLPVQLQDDFMEYIRKRFKQFDITFS